MEIETQITEVKKHIDTIIGYNEGILDLNNYSLGSKSPKRKDSRYGLIYDILTFGDEGNRIIDKCDKNKLKYLFDQCMYYINNHPVRDLPGGFSRGHTVWKKKKDDKSL